MPADWASAGAAPTRHSTRLARPTRIRDIAASTIQAIRSGAAAVRARPLALTAAAAVALEASIAAGGGHSGFLAVIVLIVAPGLALIPLLPVRARSRLVTALALAPVVGFAASAVGLITVSSLGLALDGVVIRLVAAALVAVGFALRGSEPPAGGGREEALAGAGLAAAVGLGVALESRVLSGWPIPGNDWAKYVLYADEIRRQGSLLIDNPFWMLGVPFREDPGTPAIYGSYLVMTGQHAAVLIHGIWVFATMSILAVFGFVRSFWGTAAGVVAAALWAALPMSQDILAWHGLPNQAALAVLLVLLLYCASLFTDRFTRTTAAGFGLVFVALAATHRLSLLVGLGAIAIAVGAAFVLGDLRRAAQAVLPAAVAALLLGAGVAYDLVERQRTFGGMLSYADYATSKFNGVATARDLTFAFTAIAAIAVVIAIRRAGRDRALIPLLAMLAFTMACAYAWVVQLPLAYVRMAYYLPLALVPLVAAALAGLPRRWLTLAAGAALAAVVAAFAWPAAEQVRHFYAFTNPASLRGLDAVAAQLRPGEVVVTDRCWSFQATWLLHTRTLPALYPADIQPKAELALANRAQSILDGTPEGVRLARRLGVRFLLVDPSCPDPRGEALEPPRVGEPAFISERLVVLRLDS